jgi:stalled ribosome rescue protein Dom34
MPREKREKLLTDAQIVQNEDIMDKIIAQFSKDKTS